SPGSCGDHYLCYKLLISTALAPIFNVHLVDEFEDIKVDLTHLRNLCTPADKNDEGVLDDVTHLVSYSYKPLPGTPHFVLQPHLRIDNQLGTLFVDAVKRDVLLVPSNKDISGPTVPPDDTAIGVDHYKCYKVRTTAGTSRFLSKTVSVADQFTSPAKQFVLK